MFLQVASIVYALIWIGLLIHWWRKKEFYPLFGKPLYTKIFWGLTFIFFNPLLSLWYFIFVVRLKNSGSPKRIRMVRVACFTLIAVTILCFEVPFGVQRDQVIHLTKDSPAMKTNPLQMEWSMVSFSATQISGGGGIDCERPYLDLRNIAVINHSRHPLMIKLGHNLAAYLNQIREVETVTYYPADVHRQQSGPFPGLTIELEEKSITDYLIGHKLDIAIRQTTGGGFADQPNSPYTLSSYQVSLQTALTSVGMASPSMKHNHAANEILRLTSQLNKFFSLQSKFEQPPELPEYVYGTGSETPELPIALRANQLYLSGGDVLTHNLTAIKIPPGAPIDEIRSELAKLPCGKNLSWHENTDGRGKRILEVSYRKPFSENETEQTLTKLLNDPDVDVHALLFFGTQFRSSANSDTFNTYVERINESLPSNTEEAIELGLAAHQTGDNTRALEMLKCAHAFSLLSNSGKRKLEQLADQLEARELLEQAPDAPTLKACNIHPIKPGSVYTTTGNESLRFYTKLEPDSDKIRYMTTGVQAPIWPQTRKGLTVTIPSKKTTPLALDVFTTINRMTSRTQTPGSISDDSWKAETAFNTRLPEMEVVFLRVEETAPDTYEWVISNN